MILLFFPLSSISFQKDSRQGGVQSVDLDLGMSGCVAVPTRDRPRQMESRMAVEWRDSYPLYFMLQRLL